jgi:hypothetical protein
VIPPDFSNVSIQDIAENPERYGMPTLSEFVRNKEKYMGRPDDELAAIDQGDPQLGCLQKYYVEGYRVDSLDQADRIARDMGYDLCKDFILDPQLRPDDRGGFYNEVNFRAKSSVTKRSSW